MSYRIGFIIEQVLGHVTHGQNLQTNIPKDPSIEAYWSLPAWEAPGLAGKVPNWTLRAGLQARRDVADMRRRTELDALFFHTQVTAMLSRDWLRRIPSVVSLDATPLQYDSLGEFYAHGSGPGWMENWKWRLNRNCYQDARHLVTWSEWAKRGLVEEYEVPPDKVTVIPPGVNTSEWIRADPRRDEEGPVKILFVGANLERKGGLLLLKAFRSLRAKAEANTLNGREDGSIELHLVTRTAFASEAGLYVYNDMQPNSDRLKQLFYESDIFCLPTYGDCLPMALAEAGAAGLPLVSSNVAAIPEIVQVDETGFLVPPGDADALTKVLRRLIDHPNLRLRLGEQAAQLVQSEHDAERNTQRLLSLLKSVAAGRHGSPLTQ